MAKTKRKTPSHGIDTPQSVGFSKLRVIWQAIPADTWMTILQECAADHNWHQKGATDIWGNCIHHNEDSASFHVVPRLGFGHCFGCNYHTTDPVKLVAKASNKSYGEAFSYLVTNYGPLPGLSTKTIEHVSEYDKKQQYKQLTLKLLNKELVEAATSRLSGQLAPKYRYADRLLSYLDQRGVPLNILHALPLMIVPPPGNLYDQIKAYEQSTAEKVQLDLQTFLESMIPKGAGSAASSYEGWLAFANHISPSTIGAIRLREPEHGSKHFLVYNQGEAHDDHLGFFGLGTSLFAPLIGREDSFSKEVIVTEGEFDALAAIVPQVIRGSADRVVIAAGGNSTASLDILSTCGFDTIKYIPDWDRAGTTVLQSKLKNTESMRMRIFSPTKEFQEAGKDLHDVYLEYGGEAVRTSILEEGNFKFPYEWAIEQVHVQGASIDDGNVASKAKLLENFVALVRDPIERETLIQEGATFLSLDPDQIRRQVAVDSDDGYINQVINVLRNTYEFMYQEAGLSGKRVVVWNKLLKSQSSLDVSKFSTILSMLKVDLGSTVDWMERLVGTPIHFQPQVDEAGTLIPAKPKEIRRKHYELMLENDVFPRIFQASNLPQKAEMTTLGQGVHIPSRDVVYIVNGALIIKGIKEDGAYKWRTLASPHDDRYLFESDAAKKWSTILDDTVKMSTWELHDLASILKATSHVLDTGFRFDNHDLECQYLPAFLIAGLIVDTFDHVPWIFFHGPTNTGKSSLNYVLSSQDINNRACTLYEHSVYMDNFTPAGVKQHMKGSKLSLVLDEFEVGPESSNETKHNNARAVLELMRGGISKGTKITQGSASGNSVSWSLRFPLVTSGIYSFHKPEDINRVNTIQMAVNGPGLSEIKTTSPSHLINALHGPAKIAALREAISAVAIQNIDRIKEAYTVVKAEYATGQYTDSRTQSRFREQLLPILAVMKAAGFDYKTFSAEYTTYKSARTSETMSATRHDELWQALLHTNAIQLGQEEFGRTTYTLGQILNDTQLRAALNKSGSGIYFLAEDEVLAIVWPTVVSGLVLRSSRFHGFGRPETIRNILSHDPRMIDGKNKPYVQKLTSNLHAIAGMVKEREVSFIKASEFMTGASAERNSAEAAFETAAEDGKEVLLRKGLQEAKILRVEDNI